MSRQSHLERISKEKANKTTITELKVSGNTIIATYATGDTKDLCELRQLAIHGCDSLLGGNVTYTQPAKQNLHEITSVAQDAWDDEHMKWTVVPQYNDDGEMADLVVPLECELMDDVVIQELISNSGYTAHNFEDKLQNNGHEVYNLSNTNVYTDDLENPSVFVGRSLTEVVTREEHDVSFSSSSQSTSRTYKYHAGYSGLFILYTSAIAVLSILLSVDGYLGLIPPTILFTIAITSPIWLLFLNETSDNSRKFEVFGL